MLQLVQELQIKIKTDELEFAKKNALFITSMLFKGNFIYMSVLSQCVVYKLSE